MPVLERTVEARCMRYAKRKGLLPRKMNGLGFRSWHDRLFAPPKGSRWHAPILWVEFKREGHDLTPAQAAHRNDMTARGQECHTVRTFEEFQDVVHNYLAACVENGTHG